MANPIIGSAGTVTIASVGTTWITKWEVSSDIKTKDLGPFIGDPNTYTVTTQRSIKGKIEATVPSGKDAGQTLLVSGAINGTYVPIVLVTTGGYVVTIPSGQVTNFNISQDAGDSVKATFDFASVGAYTIV